MAGKTPRPAGVGPLVQATPAAAAVPVNRQGASAPGPLVGLALLHPDWALALRFALAAGGAYLLLRALDRWCFRSDLAPAHSSAPGPLLHLRAGLPALLATAAASLASGSTEKTLAYLRSHPAAAADLTLALCTGQGAVRLLLDRAVLGTAIAPATVFKAPVASGPFGIAKWHVRGCAKTCVRQILQTLSATFAFACVFA